VIATSVSYDLVFLVHIAAAVATMIVFIAMRFDALAVANGASADVQAKRFPQRRNWAARFLHVLPITGLIMTLSGGDSVSFSKPWIGVGIVMYIAAAGHLEARTLPQERELSLLVARQGAAPPEMGRKLAQSVDVLLVLVAIALLSMIIQY
jgi:hypothetical protein